MPHFFQCRACSNPCYVMREGNALPSVCVGNHDDRADAPHWEEMRPQDIGMHFAQIRTDMQNLSNTAAGAMMRMMYVFSGVSLGMRPLRQVLNDMEPGERLLVDTLLDGENPTELINDDYDDLDPDETDWAAYLNRIEENYTTPNLVVDDPSDELYRSDNCVLTTSDFSDQQLNVPSLDSQIARYQVPNGICLIFKPDGERATFDMKDSGNNPIQSDRFRIEIFNASGTDCLGHIYPALPRRPIRVNPGDNIRIMTHGLENRIIDWENSRVEIPAERLVNMGRASDFRPLEIDYVPDDQHQDEIGERFRRVVQGRPPSLHQCWFHGNSCPHNNECPASVNDCPDFRHNAQPATGATYRNCVHYGNCPEDQGCDDVPSDSLFGCSNYRPRSTGEVRHCLEINDCPDVCPDPPTDCARYRGPDIEPHALPNYRWTDAVIRFIQNANHLPHDADPGDRYLTQNDGHIHARGPDGTWEEMIPGVETVLIDRETGYYCYNRPNVGWVILTEIQEEWAERLLGRLQREVPLNSTDNLNPETYREAAHASTVAIEVLESAAEERITQAIGTGTEPEAGTIYKDIPLVRGLRRSRRTPSYRNQTRGDCYLRLNSRDMILYDGSNWIEITPTLGMITKKANGGGWYYFKDGTWVTLSAVNEPWAERLIERMNTLLPIFDSTFTWTHCLDNADMMGVDIIRYLEIIHTMVDTFADDDEPERNDLSTGPLINPSNTPTQCVFAGHPEISGMAACRDCLGSNIDCPQFRANEEEIETENDLWFDES